MNLMRSAEDRQRVLLVLVTLMFLLSWITLLGRITRYWGEIPHAARYWAIMFAALYPSPWLMLVLKNRSKIQMAVLAYFALFAAMKFLFP